MALGPVQRRSVAGDVYQQLSDEILTGSYVPGQSLPAERRLAELLGVNRGAVREAIQRLAAAGFVESRQGAGTVVLDYRRQGGLALLPRLLWRDEGVDAKAVRAVAELRTCIGVDAARLAAQRRNSDDIDALQALAADLAQAPDRAGRQIAALALWSGVIDASDNIAYRLALNSLMAAYQPLQPLLLDLLAAELDDIAGHQDLVRAIQASQPEVAANAATDLLAQGAAALSGLATALGLPPAPK